MLHANTIALRPRCLLTILLVTIQILLHSPLCRAQQTERVNVCNTGGQTSTGGHSQLPCLSQDGRFVAFSSKGTNLITTDTNGREDVFVRDRQTNQTTRVSVSSTGLQGTEPGQGGSQPGGISSDGRYVVFRSDFNNLVSGDTNGAGDIFVHDRNTGQTAMVSVSSAGVQGNLGSYAPVISGDGRYIAFASQATNLVTGDTTVGMTSSSMTSKLTKQLASASQVQAYRAPSRDRAAVSQVASPRTGAM